MSTPCINSSDRFLTLSEVRVRLNVSRATVYRWTAENGLKVVRIGHVTRVRESDLQEFLTRHETLFTARKMQGDERENKRGAARSTVLEG